MENIKNEISNIINNIPEVGPLEKVRWIYIKLGKILSFDYKNINYKNEIDLNNSIIEKYETCTQISFLLNEILNSIDSNIKSSIVERKIPFHSYDQEHVANLVEINEKKYLLDLTLDLYRIHFGLSTLEFGYSNYEDSDIISKQECLDIDKRLGLVDEDYIDIQLDSIINEIAFTDFKDVPFEEEIKYKLDKIKPILDLNDTYSESNQFIYNVVLDNILKCQTIRTIIRNNNNQKYVYIFKRNSQILWYLFDESNNFYKSNQNEILDLLNNGWTNNKGIIFDYITQSEIKL